MRVGGRAAPQGRREIVRAVISTGLAAVVLTTIYYVLPVPGQMSGASWAILFFGGMAVLALVIVITVLRLLQAGPDTRVRSLVVLLCAAVLFFSWADVALAKAPGQFVGLHTKTDALYFSVSTLSTVGFGDVHAASQLAEAAVTLQIVFNLVFLGLAITTMSSWIRHQAGRLRGSASGSHQDQT